MKVLVTPRSFGSTSRRPVEMLEEKGYDLIFNPFGRPYTREELLEIVPDIDAVIIGIDPFDGEIMKKASKLKVISKYGIGIDNIDVQAASERNIIVTNTPTANNDAVADLTFGLMLALARRIPEADRETKAGNWKKYIGASIWGKKVGIVGLGKIGKQVAKRARGFNMEILGYDIFRNEEFAQKYGVKHVDLEELLKKADYVTIHTPLNENTRNLISQQELEMMKHDAFLINTSRGGIVNEGALYQALKEGLINGAALDAYTEEPPENSPLKELDNIIMTSHNGAYTKEAIANMGIQAARNLIDVLEGREVKNRVN
jgi:D-3-phosphoglycerate dehydrogenase / 2-oxoglutarate reductase